MLNIKRMLTKICERLSTTPTATCDLSNVTSPSITYLNGHNGLALVKLTVTTTQETASGGNLTTGTIYLNGSDSAVNGFGLSFVGARALVAQITNGSIVVRNTGTTDAAANKYTLYLVVTGNF